MNKPARYVPPRLIRFAVECGFLFPWLQWKVIERYLNRSSDEEVEAFNVWLLLRITRYRWPK